ncbi:MAG TPA: WxL domain-containing protein [Solirubrobacterales bacterium]|nr:WxL domain-containing protein [Solirubrobacterales bacterium]
MHRTSLRLGAILVAAAALAFPASSFAATATTTGTVTGGELALTTSAAPTFSATLNGTDQTPTYTLPLTIEDMRGTGAGWNATVTSTQFTTGGETPHTLSTSASSITGVSNACVEGGSCTDPTNAISYPLTVPAGAEAAAVKFFNAAEETGLGVFSNTPTVAVSIPADTYAGSYTSTITLASVSGP